MPRRAKWTDLHATMCAAPDLSSRPRVCSRCRRRRRRGRRVRARQWTRIRRRVHRGIAVRERAVFGRRRRSGGRMHIDLRASPLSDGIHLRNRRRRHGRHARDLRSAGRNRWRVRRSLRRRIAVHERVVPQRCAYGRRILHRTLRVAAGLFRDRRARLRRARERRSGLCAALEIRGRRARCSLRTRSNIRAYTKASRSRRR